MANEKDQSQIDGALKLLRALDWNPVKKIGMQLLSSITVFSILSIASSSIAIPARVNGASKACYKPSRGTISKKSGFESNYTCGGGRLLSLQNNTIVEVLFCRQEDHACYLTGREIASKEYKHLVRAIGIWIPQDSLCDFDSNGSFAFFGTCGSSTDSSLVSKVLEASDKKLHNYFCESNNNPLYWFNPAAGKSSLCQNDTTSNNSSDNFKRR